MLKYLSISFYNFDFSANGKEVSIGFLQPVVPNELNIDTVQNTIKAKISLWVSYCFNELSSY